MITLGAYFGNNLVSYKAFFLDLGREGITHIRGLNRDGKDRNNGSGKSLLLRGIPDILFCENPFLGKTKKDLFDRDTKLTIEVGGVSIEKSLSTSIAYSIDGESVKQDVARECIWEQIPIDSEDFFTYVYLDALRPYPLTTGSPLDRIKILSHIFRLDGFDALYQWFGDKLSGTRQLEQKAKWLEQQLAEIPQYEDLQPLLKKAKARRKALQAEYDNCRDEIAQFERADEHNKKVDRRKKLKKFVGDHKLDEVVILDKRLKKEWAAYDAFRSRKPITEKPNNGNIDELRGVVASPIGEGSIHSIEHRMLQAAGKWWFYDHASNCGDECPVCGGTNKKQYAKKLPEAERQLQSVLIEYRAACRHSGVDAKAHREAKSLLSKWEAYVSNKEYDAQTLSMKTDKPKHPRDYYESVIEALEEMATLPIKYVESGESDLPHRLEVANDFIIDLEKRIAVGEANEARRRELQTSLADIQSLLEDKHILKVLQDAYSNKGIRMNTLSDICSRLESNLNYWSWTVFPEPIHFSIEVTQTKVDILAYRSPCTEWERVSDVRQLSGGEMRAFNLLLLLSLLPLIPDSRRTNIVILDECTANMDNPTKHLVYEQYIPLLSEIVPHVIVLDTGTTPIDDALELYAVKENGTTTLQETI